MSLIDNAILDDIPVLGFAAYSGTGKTTLLEKLIPELSLLNIRTAIIKLSHHDIDVDHPGKDSYRLRKAGAQQTLLASPYHQVLITEYTQTQEPELPLLLKQLNREMVDIILVEGFRHLNYLPKIELNRPNLNKPLLFPEDKSIIALATDDHNSITQNFSTTPPLLPLNKPATIARFVKEYFCL
jgi:molybdopterin-guanine dinucleotide biosynthesis protein MobB